MSYTPKYPAGPGRCYDHGYCGPESVAIGLRMLAAGEVETVSFLVSAHHSEGGELFRIATIGIDSNGTLRYCGEGGKPNGPGSHELHHTTSELDVAIANLVYDLAIEGERAARTRGLSKGAYIFREVGRGDPSSDRQWISVRWKGRVAGSINAYPDGTFGASVPECRLGAGYESIGEAARQIAAVWHCSVAELDMTWQPSLEPVGALDAH